MAENWQKIARSLGYIDEKNMWYNLYTVDGNSIDNLYQRLGYATHTIRKRLKVCNIEVRSRGGSNGATPPALNILFHIDQRIIWSRTIKELTELTGCSPAVISRYRTTSQGGE